MQSRFLELPYTQPREIAPGVSLRLFDAGHILGSASVELTIEDYQRRRVLVFSGDLGPRNIPILRDPVPPDPTANADLVVLESTYGDRDHRPLEETLAEFLRVLQQAVRAREKVLIPAFAIGRTQHVLYSIAEFVREGELPKFPIYLDSPMAIKAMALYRTHRDLFDEEAADLVDHHSFDQDLSELHYCQTKDESRALNYLEGPAVIIAGSGMCEGGRIVHHLKHNLWRADVHVVIVGYQSSGSLGAQLVHRAKRVKIHGEMVAINAKIHTLGGFSAHAGQRELADWAGHYLTKKPQPRIALTHGEERPRQALADSLRDRFGVDCLLPKIGECLSLD
jgi:metallo-beta-lactamase family protein